MANEEMQTKSGLSLATPRQTAKLFGRALILRCPHCGGGPVLKHWLKLRVSCGKCGLRLERGEHDSFTGSMFILFTLVGLAGYAILAVTMAVTEETPWDLLDYGLPVLAVVLLLVLFPFSKLLWLAFDLMLRPVTQEELEWHRTAGTRWSSEQQPRA